jgi:hypothetical protein
MQLRRPRAGAGRGHLTVHGLLRICAGAVMALALAVMALALVQVAYLAARVDLAPSAVASMTPTDGTELIGGPHLGVGASGAPSSTGDAAESQHVHGPDPVSAALLALDGLVTLAVIVLLARRPRPRRAAGRSAPRRPRNPDVAEPAEP